uniref:Uncharacterized protein n=1 Tax=Arundo donax TaxID=35708 RepID=A0A0A9N692_ARUDO
MDISSSPILLSSLTQNLEYHCNQNCSCRLVLYSSHTNLLFFLHNMSYLI